WSSGFVKEIHCFEADARLIPLIYSTHEKNGVKNSFAYHRAITSDPEAIDRGYVDFHVRNDFWGNSLNAEKGRKVAATHRVAVANIQTIVDQVHPTVIICDIEGAEYGLFSN